MTSSHFHAEALEQPGALRSTVLGTVDARAELVRRAAGTRRVVLVGSGDSYYLGFAAAVALEQLAGIPAETIEAYDLVSARLHALGSGTLVIAVSASGKAVRTLQAVELARRAGALTVALTNDEDCPLVDAADVALVTEGAPSYSFPTRTTTSAIAVLAALAADLGLAAGRLPAVEHAGILAELSDALPERMGKRLADPTGIATAAESIVASRHTLVVGSGAARTAALIGAAKLYETCRRHSGAVNAEEYLHLLGFAAGSEDTVVVVPTPYSFERELQVATYAAGQGAPVLAVEPWPAGDERHLPGVTVLPVDGADLRPWSGAILACTALHLLASQCSGLLGTDADRPEGVDLDYVLNDLLYAAPLAGW